MLAVAGRAAAAAGATAAAGAAAAAGAGAFSASAFSAHAFSAGATGATAAPAAAAAGGAGAAGAAAAAGARFFSVSKPLQPYVNYKDVSAATIYGDESPGSRRRKLAVVTLVRAAVLLGLPGLLYYGSRRRLAAAIRARDARVTDYVYFDVAKNDRYLGRMLVGLFGRDVPMTVANFVRLAEGHQLGDGREIGYRGTQFHAIVLQNFALAGDVVSGDGACSLSIFGPSFPDESLAVPLLRRGDLMMFSPRPHANGSQFAVALKPQPRFRHRFVVFGTVLAGGQLLRVMAGDVDPYSHLPDPTRQRSPARIVACGRYVPGETTGPPACSAEALAGGDREITYATRRPHVPITAFFTGQRLAADKVARMRAGEKEAALLHELKDEFKQNFDDPRKESFLSASRVDRRELRAAAVRRDAALSDQNVNLRIRDFYRARAQEKAQAAVALAREGADAGGSLAREPPSATAGAGAA